jgi:hypothetical protein
MTPKANMTGWLMLEYINTVVSTIAIIIASVSLGITWKKMKTERPLIRHEVLNCMHKVSKDGKITNLELVFRLHNEGDRGTGLAKIEAYVVDIMGNQHLSSEEMSKHLKAHDTTNKITSFFDFVPTFQYGTKMKCKFVIYHTHDEYLFEFESQEAEEPLNRSGW